MIMCKDCGKRIYWVGAVGLWYHWSTNDMLACDATTVEPAGPYDALTKDELGRLATKLSHAGHAFYESSAAIANTALYLEKAGRIAVLSPEWDGLWDLREPVVDAMDEMHDLMHEVDDTVRARREVERSGLPQWPVKVIPNGGA